MRARYTATVSKKDPENAPTKQEESDAQPFRI